LVLDNKVQYLYHSPHCNHDEIAFALPLLLLHLSMVASSDLDKCALKKDKKCKGKFMWSHASMLLVTLLGSVKKSSMHTHLTCYYLLFFPVTDCDPAPAATIYTSCHHASYSKQQRRWT
jgi:hypothetical protein